MMKKEYIRIKYVASRMNIIDTLKEFLDSKRLEEWRNRENKYVTFYESIIESLWPDDIDDAEANRKYFKAITYNEEELDAVIAYTNAIKEWAHPLHPKALGYEAEHGSYDYIYLTDEHLPEMLAGARKLYDLMIANDEKYDFNRSYRGSMDEDDWYDKD